MSPITDPEKEGRDAFEAIRPAHRLLCQRYDVAMADWSYDSILSLATAIHVLWFGSETRFREDCDTTTFHRRWAGFQVDALADTQFRCWLHELCHKAAVTRAMAIETLSLIVALKSSLDGALVSQGTHYKVTGVALCLADEHRHTPAMSRNAWADSTRFDHEHFYAIVHESESHLGSSTATVATSSFDRLLKELHMNTWASSSEPVVGGSPRSGHSTHASDSLLDRSPELPTP